MLNKESFFVSKVGSGDEYKGVYQLKNEQGHSIVLIITPDTYSDPNEAFKVIHNIIEDMEEKQPCKNSPAS